MEKHLVAWIPEEWIERSAECAARGEQMAVFSRLVQIERRVLDLPIVLDRRVNPFTSIETVELLLQDLLE
jgi:hypothetical protein